MSPQLQLSATLSALTMTLLALAVALGGMDGGVATASMPDAPAIYSATIGK